MQSTEPLSIDNNTETSNNTYIFIIFLSLFFVVLLISYINNYMKKSNLMNNISLNSNRDNQYTEQSLSNMMKRGGNRLEGFNFNQQSE